MISAVGQEEGGELRQEDCEFEVNLTEMSLQLLALDINEIWLALG